MTVQFSGHDISMLVHICQSIVRSDIYGLNIYLECKKRYLISYEVDDVCKYMLDKDYTAFSADIVETGDYLLNYYTHGAWLGKDKDTGI